MHKYLGIERGWCSRQTREMCDRKMKSCKGNVKKAHVRKLCKKNEREIERSNLPIGQS